MKWIKSFIVAVLIIVGIIGIYWFVSTYKNIVAPMILLFFFFLFVCFIRHTCFGESDPYVYLDSNDLEYED